MADHTVRSPVTGTVWKIETTAGSDVDADEIIMILESMKMEIPIGSPASGKIKEFRVAEGDQIEEDQELAIITA